MEFYGRIYIHLRASDCESRRLYGSWRNSARRKPDRINSSNSDVPGAAAVRSIIIKAAKTRSVPLPSPLRVFNRGALEREADHLPPPRVLEINESSSSVRLIGDRFDFSAR
jgi:hypothetical protein